MQADFHESPDLVKASRHEFGQSNLDTLARLVEAQPKVECPGCENPFCPHGLPLGGDSCHGTGQVPDPAFAGLLEVLREKCVMRSPVHTCLQRADNGEVEEKQGQHWTRKGCPYCKGTGYRTRNCEGWPKGALKGAIWEHLPPGWMLSEIRNGKGAFRGLALLVAGQSYVSSSLDPDVATTQVCIEAMAKQNKEGK